MKNSEVFCGVGWLSAVLLVWCLLLGYVKPGAGAWWALGFFLALGITSGLKSLSDMPRIKHR